MEYTEEAHNNVISELEKKHPKMFPNGLGYIGTGPGWWPVVAELCSAIESHTKWTNDRRQQLLENNPYDVAIPDEVPQVVVDQIKEKFGGLRFYYHGGDNYIRGLVSMAESWASKTCEQCGAPGVIRRGGWIRTLCNVHAGTSDDNTEYDDINDALDSI